MKWKKTFINCKSMLPEEVVREVIPVHLITGSDNTSGFYGHGNKSVLQKVICEARELIANVRQSLEMEDEVSEDMTSFVLSYVYSERKDMTCGQARASKWHKQKKKSAMRLPPDKDTLSHHS